MKRTTPPAAPPDTSYEKVSATLDRDVLRMIRERTDNVSSFLNDAAKDRLYFERLKEMDAELERQGVGIDQKLHEGLGRFLEARERHSARRKGARRRAG